MRPPVNSVFGIMFFMSLSLMSGYGSCRAQSQGTQPAGTADKPSFSIPDLADIVPMAAELSGRLATLENNIKGGPDIPEVENRYQRIEENLTGPAGQVQRLKDSEDVKYNRLLELREIIERENKSFKEISRPIDQAVRQLGAWRNDWLLEKKRWKEWQSVLSQAGVLDQVASSTEKANDTIDTALDLILPQLEALLKIQEKAGHIHARLSILSAELEGLIVEGRRSALLSESPPMFSFQYISQLGYGTLWNAVQTGLDEVTWPGNRFLVRQGWVVLLQVLICLFVIVAVYRNRRALTESKRWRFLSQRPFSAGLFLAYMATVWLYEYEGAPATWKLAHTAVAGIAFARLSEILVDVSWKRQFVYGLIIILIVTQSMNVFNFPLPLFRLYMVLAAMAGLFFCLRWTKQSGLHQAAGLYTVPLRLACLFFAVIIIVQFWGRAAVTLFLFDALIHSTATTLVFMLFLYMVHGGVEWVFHSAPLKSATLLQGLDTGLLIRRVSRFIDFVICVLVLLPAILMIWGVYNSLEAATKGLLSLGFSLGSQRITIGLVLVSTGVVYGSFLGSWILQKMLMNRALIRGQLEKGLRHSITRLMHYVIIFVGFLLALSTLGFEVTKLTIVLSALGVGIGFGLQGVVNNFVSGLILLFERPVRVGDYIEAVGTWAEIKRIGLRSTTVQTFDQADVIIPNADLVANQVTNWTLSNRQVRLMVPVGVAYGSDVPLVMEILEACAKDHERVSTLRPPQVLFLSFGESSLDFELRVWVTDADYRLTVRSDLNQEIDRRFREANIEIAFPQRDLHLRSVDDSVRMGVPARSVATEKT